MATIVYTSDLHGEMDFYRAAGKVALERQAAAIVLGGDLCPGTPSASHIDLPESQPEFLRHKVKPLLETWKAARPRLRVLAIPGNDDCQTILATLDELEAEGLAENLHGRVKSLEGFTLMGLGFVPPTPFAIKDFERRDARDETVREPQIAKCVLGTRRGFEEIPDFAAYLRSLPSLEEELERLPASDPRRTVAVIHTPPFNTDCDVLLGGTHIGSRALRRWIEARQPLVTLHGHIHESPRQSGFWFDRIGETLVINPGCDHSHPHLVVLELENLAEIEHSIYGRLP